MPPDAPKSVPLDYSMSDSMSKMRIYVTILVMPHIRHSVLEPPLFALVERGSHAATLVTSSRLESSVSEVKIFSCTIPSPVPLSFPV